MTSIRSHQWLELKDLGMEACQSRSVRVEEKEALIALRSPVRVVDLFRRLRVTDGRLFQEMLSRFVGRGWVAVHENNPLEVELLEPEAEAEAPSADALGALLARYAQEEGSAAQKLGVELPDWEAPSAPLPSPSVESREPLEQSSPEPAQAGVKPVEPAYVETGPEGADALLAAMGVSPGSAPGLMKEHEEASGKNPEPSFGGGNQALLDALAAALPTEAPSAPVKIPEYGLAAPRQEDPLDGGFVRLKDVGVTFGASGGNADSASGSAGSGALKKPHQTLEEPTTRTRHRQAARERMLSAARREEADRQAAKERARQFKERKEAEEAQRKETVARQRATEEMSRGQSFLSRTEKARRIRDGLPPKSD